GDRAHQGAREQELLAEDVLLDCVPARVRGLGLDAQQLLAVVPLIQRLGLVEALVTLQADQLALEKARERLGELGLADTGWEAVQEDIFGEEFLLARPLMTAIASEEPVVLLIDEIDKTDQEFEAMLLEVLSDFQISIPELGRVSSTTHPVVLLTSNNSRELTEALKRRCLYLWLDYPALEHELEIVKLHAPDLPEAVARRLVEVVGMVRELDLKKPPSIAESIDWARALLLLGASDIDADTFAETMSVIVKHRTDMDIVAERVGLKLAQDAEPANVQPA
ncbi:MAG TPA: MoxR family ATPase, partial [Solirubrobacteraceae bacterium]